MTERRTHKGGCHCGAVRYEAELALERAIACNCSICQKRGYMLAFVPAGDFRLVSGGDRQTDYQFGKKVIHHLFCATCGVASFGRGKGPDGSEMVALNVRTIDDIDLAAVPAMPFDGKSL